MRKSWRGERSELSRWVQRVGIGASVIGAVAVVVAVAVWIVREERCFVELEAAKNEMAVLKAAMERQSQRIELLDRLASLGTKVRELERRAGPGKEGERQTEQLAVLNIKIRYELCKAANREYDPYKLECSAQVRGSRESAGGEPR